MLTGQWKVKPRWPTMEANFGRQLHSPTRACTSVSVPYATFYSFLNSFLSKYAQNISLKDRNEFKNFKYISTKSSRLTGYIFSWKQITKLTRNLTKRPRKITFGNYLVLVLSLPPSDNLVHWSGQTATMNLFKYSIMWNWSSNTSSEHFFRGWQCFRSRTKHKQNIKVVQRTGTDVQNSGHGRTSWLHFLPVQMTGS